MSSGKWGLFCLGYNVLKVTQQTYRELEKIAEPTL